MSRTQMCRFCTFMTCGDANWCSVTEETYPEERLSEENNCKDFEFNEIDALTLKKDYAQVVRRKNRAAAERALYERRMKGDWS